MGAVAIMPGYDKAHALDMCADLVTRVDNKSWGLGEDVTDVAVGPGNWWRYKGNSDGPYGFQSTLRADDQSGIMAGEMLTAISILARFGRATDTQKAHAKSCVAAIYASGCYDASSKDFFPGITGGGSFHQFAFHWISQGLLYYYRYLATDDHATVLTMLRSLTYWNYTSSFVDSGGVENKSQSLGTFVPSAYLALAFGVHVPAYNLSTLIGTALDDFTNTYMATTYAVHGDWTYHYDYRNAAGGGVNDSSYKPYYHGLMLSGLRHYDEIVAAGYWTPNATQKAKLKNFAHAFLRAYGQFGSQIEYTTGSQYYRHGVFMRQCMLALAAIICNADLQPDSDSAGIARGYLDAAMEHVLAADGILLGTAGGVSDTVDGLPSPLEMGGINWNSTRASSLVNTPTTYAMASSETAMNLALVANQGEVWTVTPKQLPVKACIDSALGGLRVATPAYSMVFGVVKSTEGSGSVFWPYSHGSEPIHLLDWDGEPIGAWNQRFTFDGNFPIGLLMFMRIGSTYYANGYRPGDETPTAVSVCDGQGVISDMLTPITAYSLTDHLRQMKPGALPYIETLKVFKQNDGTAMDVGNRYQGRARYTFYRDFCIRKATWELNAGSTTTADAILHFPSCDPCCIEVYQTNGGQANTWRQVWTGTATQSMDGGTLATQAILIRRDSKARSTDGSTANHAIAWCPVDTNGTLYNGTAQSGGAVQCTPSSVMQFCTAGLRIWLQKAGTLADGFYSEWMMLPLTAMVDSESAANTRARALNAYTYAAAFSAARVSTGGALKPDGFQMWFAAINGTNDNFAGFERKHQHPWLKIIPSTGNVKVFYGGKRDANILPSATMTATISVTGLNGSFAVVNVGGTNYNVALVNGEGTVVTGLSLTNTGYAVRLVRVSGAVKAQPLNAVQTSTAWRANHATPALRS